ncbi:MAG: DUF3987 domain-containing protein [Scytonema sp. PMC 1069.18]|nr:DUF3987 domain-containing protein [Scytonema sp. PMC 1069.18]MEC4884596.1 DUF3987 domain-containing protein [Scytonema sp. PMC 1070.18]
MTAQFSSLKIDTNQAIKQLELLGYQQGDAIYVRAFLPKEDSRSAPNTGRKADRLNFKQILRWQQQGYGIYFVVNGGGHKDENVHDCRAVFIEHDDLELEIQRSLWQTLSLPEPTFQIQTRKSVHSYWVFEKPISVEEWKQLQTDLLTYTNADPAIKNPSRVMRLAGAWHMKPGEEPLMCNIISESGIRYTYENLRDSVPLSQNPEFIQQECEAVKSPNQASVHKQQYTRYEDFSIPVPVAVPLEVCLSKDSRALLNSGVNEGGRNSNGAKLARDLIGTANYLTSIGQQFDGAPQQLLQDYASRCTPPLPAKEVDAIWFSAQKDNPGPSCTPNGVETCIRAWYWNTYIKPLQSSVAGSGRSGSPENGHFSRVGKRLPIEDITLCGHILEILSRHDSSSMRSLALMNLAAEVGFPYRQIEQLAKLLTSEVDLQTDTSVATQKLSSLLKTYPEQLDLTRFLEPELAQVLIDTAQAMPTTPEFLFTTLLGVAASRIGSAARIVIKPSAQYTQPLVMWTGIVADSGSVKTPAQRVIIDPLVQLEAEAFERYQIEVAEYNKLQTARKNNKQNGDTPEELPNSPVRQRFLTKDITLETLQRIHSENPRGLLYYRDELAGLFKTRNQYRGGLGADEEQELDQFNGAAIIYDRSDKSVCLPKSAISRTGSIQWEVLAAMMGDHNDYNGNFARWLFCAAKSPKRYLEVEENATPDTGISVSLRQLYIKLAQVPEQDYFLSSEAGVCFQTWQHSLVDAQLAEETYGLKVVYPKIESYTARLALWLHIVNAVLRGETPSQIISDETMSKAIELGAYFLWQHKIIHAQNSPDSELMSWGLKIQKLAERLGRATASALKSGIRALRKKSTFEIRRLMEMMALAGWGRIEGEGSNSVYVPEGIAASTIDKIDRELTKVSIAQTPTNTVFDNRIDSIDTNLSVSVSLEQVAIAQADLNSSLDLTDLETRQFVNSNAQKPTATGTDSIDTPCQSGCQLSTDESSNMELGGELAQDHVSHFVESGVVPMLLSSDGESAPFAEPRVEERLQLEFDSPSPGNDEEVQKCLSQESIERVASNAFAQKAAPFESVASDGASPISVEVSEDVTAQTEQKGNTTAAGRNLNNRKLQPVEVLTATGEWIRGYFIHACVMVANFVGMDRQFTLFDANGEMYVFFGQIRVLSE